MNVRMLNPDVYYATDPIRKINAEQISALIDKAVANPSEKCRICLHRKPDDSVHEMLIAMCRGVTYPPHRFLKGEETHFVLHGQATLRLYTDQGEMFEAIPMGDFSSGKTSYVRMPPATWHDMVIDSDVCVYLETKSGPFLPENNEIAAFA